MEDLDSLEHIQNLFDNTGLLDILIAFEEYLDLSDLYVFENWIDGEIVEGPVMSKYWVDITLKYDASALPDPRGALLFKNTGTKVQIRQDTQNVPIRIPQSNDDMTNHENVRKPKVDAVPVMLVKFTVPRKLVDPASSDEYRIIDAENMSNILVDDEPPAEPEQQEDGFGDEMGGDM